MGEQEPRRSRPGDDPLAETVADMPSPVDEDAAPSQAPAKPPPSPPPRNSTKAPPLSRAPRVEEDLRLADGPTERSRDAATRNNDVDLNEVFDKPATPNERARLDLDDPEAGRVRAARELRIARKQATAALASPFGQLVVALVLLLVGVALAIMASIEQTTPLLIAAGIAFPITLWLAHRRYQRWLGHRRYMYRLLETLGEDVSEFDPLKSTRAVKVRTIKK